MKKDKYNLILEKNPCIWKLKHITYILLDISK